MISVSEALQIVNDNSFRLDPILIKMDEACGLTLAEDVTADCDIPAFPQSSMDGYAFSFRDWNKKEKLIIDGEVPAGLENKFSIHPKQAVRIFTGAPLPEGTDTVVMQEKVSVDNHELSITDTQLSAGSNVRPKGSEIRAGEVALEMNTRLSPAGIGFLAGIGIHKVKVYPRPDVSIIVTGNELIDPGKLLKSGQVYESNSYTLKSALSKMDLGISKTYKVKDDPDEITKILKKSLAGSQLVLLAGGISVGDYDFVLRALEAGGVIQMFHKIKQKPGKPLYFGKKDNTIVFGLPGNPSSVLTCFYEYVVPVISKMMNQNKSVIKTVAVLAEDYKKNPEITYFLKGKMEGNKVTPLDAQESYRMRSYAKANCLIKMDEGTGEYKEGDTVEVHIFPE